MIYMDSSALIKLVREERETAALIAWLGPQAEVPVLTSELGRVEVLRAARRATSHEPELIDRAHCAARVADNARTTPFALVRAKRTSTGRGG